jgi:hypothetical protein
MERPAQGRQIGKFSRLAVARNAEIGTLVDAPRARHTNASGVASHAG